MKESLSHDPDLSVLITASEIAERVAAMARQIAEDYRGRKVLVIVVLKGAFVFASDLVRSLGRGLDLQIEFVRASSYGDETVSSGTVDLRGPDPRLVEGRHVLVVEDILDTGRTLTALLDRLRTMHPESVEAAALLVKDRDRMAGISVRYAGFHIPDVFVVGYGLDHAQDYRQLPDIRMLESP